MNTIFLRQLRVIAFVILGLQGLSNLAFTQTINREQIYPKQQYLKSAMLNHSRIYPGNFLLKFESVLPDAFFCRKERVLEKQVGFPIRVRLGDWEFVEKYEGKSWCHIKK